MIATWNAQQAEHVAEQIQTLQDELEDLEVHTEADEHHEAEVADELGLLKAQYDEMPKPSLAWVSGF